MKKSIINEALNIACRKIDLHPEYNHYMHYSFIVQDNKIIEWATNSKMVPAIHFGYHGRLENEEYKPKMHSEVAAYRKAKGIMDTSKPFEIINIRLNKDKELRMSKPCNCCYKILKKLGCTKFYYSNNIQIEEVF